MKGEEAHDRKGEQRRKKTGILRKKGSERSEWRKIGKGIAASSSRCQIQGAAKFQIIGFNITRCSLLWW